MNAASIEKVQAGFPDYVKATERGPVVVTRRGKPVAVLLAAGDEDDLERLLMGYSPELQAMIEESRARYRAGLTIPHDQFWKEVEEENAVRRKKQTTKPKNGRNGPPARKKR
jgi:prevent-host-death family protein